MFHRNALLTVAAASVFFALPDLSFAQCSSGGSFGSPVGGGFVGGPSLGPTVPGIVPGATGLSQLRTRAVLQNSINLQRARQVALQQLVQRQFLAQRFFRQQQLQTLTSQIQQLSGENLQQAIQNTNPLIRQLAAIEVNRRQQLGQGDVAVADTR